MSGFYYNDNGNIRIVKEIYYNNNGSIITPMNIYYNNNGNILNVWSNNYSSPTILVEQYHNNILDITEYGYTKALHGRLLRGIGGLDITSVKISTGGLPSNNLFQIAWKGNVNTGVYNVFLNGTKILSGLHAIYNQFGDYTVIATTEAVNKAQFDLALLIFKNNVNKELSFNIEKIGR